MKRTLNYCLIILVMAILAILYAAPDWVVDPPMIHTAITLSTDKCPDGQFVRGYDKETGAVACGYVTGCPYADSIPLGPECDRVAPQSISPYNAAQPTDAVSAEPFVGK